MRAPHEAVLGPGADGVVVVSLDDPDAVRQRGLLEHAGLPAATLAELGLDTPRLPPGDDLLAGAATFWSVATRRLALAGEDGRLVVAGRAGSDLVDDDELTPAALGELVGRPAPRRVAVFGGAWTQEREADYAEAVELGGRLAESQVHVVNGGYGGIMEAVSRGASEAGGVAVGVTIGGWGDRVRANRWLTHEVRARDLFARFPLICDADAWVAFAGGAGTLAEIALCWNLLQADPEPNRPLVVVGDRWGRAFEHLRELLVVVRPEDHELVRRAATAGEALGLLGVGSPPA